MAHSAGWRMAWLQRGVRGSRSVTASWRVIIQRTWLPMASCAVRMGLVTKGVGAGGLDAALGAEL